MIASKKHYVWISQVENWILEPHNDNSTHIKKFFDINLEYLREYLPGQKFYRKGKTSKAWLPFKFTMLQLFHNRSAHTSLHD